MRTGVLTATTLAMAVTVAPSMAQDMRAAEEWCRDAGRGGDGASTCAVREYTVAAPALRIDAGPNGGVRVHGMARQDTLVRARIVTTAPTQAEAEALARQISVSTDQGTVHATGPEGTGNRRGWHVSYDVWVPAKADVSARTRNGGISMTDVAGTLRFDAVNGGVSLSHVAGDVRGKTVNGGVTVELAGDRWEGAGLDATTTNGGVRVQVPDGYSCQLSVATVNGGVRSDFPLTVQGKIDRRIETSLGQGGAPVRITTTNGGVHLRR